MSTPDEKDIAYHASFQALKAVYNHINVKFSNQLVPTLRTAESLCGLVTEIVSKPLHKQSGNSVMRTTSVHVETAALVNMVTANQTPLATFEVQNSGFSWVLYHMKEDKIWMIIKEPGIRIKQVSRLDGAISVLEMSKILQDKARPLNIAEIDKANEDKTPPPTPIYFSWGGKADTDLLEVSFFIPNCSFIEEYIYPSGVSKEEAAIRRDTIVYGLTMMAEAINVRVKAFDSAGTTPNIRSNGQMAKASQKDESVYQSSKQTKTQTRTMGANLTAHLALFNASSRGRRTARREVGPGTAITMFFTNFIRVLEVKANSEEEQACRSNIRLFVDILSKTLHPCQWEVIQKALEETDNMREPERTATMGRAVMVVSGSLNVLPGKVDRPILVHPVYALVSTIPKEPKDRFAYSSYAGMIASNFSYRDTPGIKDNEGLRYVMAMSYLNNLYGPTDLVAKAFGLGASKTRDECANKGLKEKTSGTCTALTLEAAYNQCSNQAFTVTAAGAAHQGAVLPSLATQEQMIQGRFQFTIVGGDMSARSLTDAMIRLKDVTTKKDELKKAREENMMAQQRTGVDASNLSGINWEAGYFNKVAEMTADELEAMGKKLMMISRSLTY